MSISLLVVHRDLAAYGDRQAVVNSLYQLAKTQIVPELASPTSFPAPPDCILVHDSQDDDVALAKSYCSKSKLETRLILFGGTVSVPSLLEDYGCQVPGNNFVANAYYFFCEWIRKGEFPGWDFMIGEPELEYALGVLHGLLPAIYGEEANDVSNEWRALESLKRRYDAGNADANLNDIWARAEKAYQNCIDKKVTGVQKALLSELRNYLLGSNSGDTGIIGILAQYRQETS